MTIRILTVFLAIFTCLSVKSQTHCSDNVNTQSTHWDDFPSTSNNNWDWTEKGVVHPVYLADNLSSPTLSIELPFFCSNPLNSGSCDGFHNVSEYPILGSEPEDLDIHPEDGWNLLIKNFGSANPSGQSVGGKKVSNPYFILYNKYTGHMKAFVALMGVQASQAAFIRVGFDEPIPNSGSKKQNTSDVARTLFSASESIIQPAKSFGRYLEFKQMNQVNYFQNTTDYQWMVCELLTMYDPCTCEQNPNSTSDVSTITLQAVTVNTVDIDAQIDGKAKEDLANGTTVNSPTGGSMPSFDKVTNVGKSVQKSAKEWDDTKKTMETVIDFGNRALVNHLAEELLAAEDFDFDKESVKNMTRAEIKSELLTNKKIQKEFGIHTKDTDAGKALAVGKSVASALPYVGVALGIIEVLVDGGSSGSSIAKKGPITYDVNLKLSGSLTEQLAVGDYIFFTPGSPVPSSAGLNLVPMYNNTLGVFNILEMPEMEYFEINQTGTPDVHVPILFSDIYGNPRSRTTCEISKDDHGDFDNVDDIKLKQYRFKNNLKYVVNPASGLELESIEASIILDYKKDEPIYTSRVDDNSNAYEVPWHPHLNKFPGPVTTHNNTVLSDEMDIRIYQIEEYNNLSLEYVTQDYPTGDESFIRFRTPYAPITCLQELDFILFGGGKKASAYLKVYVKLKRTDDPDAELVTMVFTFDCTNEFQNASLNSSSSGTYTVGLTSTDNNQLFAGSCYSPMYSATKVEGDDFEFRNVALNVAAVNMQHYIRKHSIYNGQQYLTVPGELIIPTGAIIPDNAIIKAGGIINIRSGVTIGADVTIKSAINVNLKSVNSIGPNADIGWESYTTLILGCNNLDYAALHNTKSEIQTFCNSSAYKSIAYANKKDESNFNVFQNGKLNFTINPNPSTGFFNLEFDSVLSRFEVSISDINGKVVYVKSYTNKKLVQLDISTLESGVYILNLRDSDGKVAIERLIKK